MANENHSRKPGKTIQKRESQWKTSLRDNSTITNSSTAGKTHVENSQTRTSQTKFSETKPASSSGQAQNMAKPSGASSTGSSYGRGKGFEQSPQPGSNSVNLSQGSMNEKWDMISQSQSSIPSQTEPERTQYSAPVSEARKSPERSSYQTSSYNSGSSGYVPSEQHIVIGRSSGRSDSYNRGPKVSGSQEYNINPGLNQSSSGSGKGFEPSPRPSQVSSNSVNLSSGSVNEKWDMLDNKLSPGSGSTSSPSSPRVQEPVSQNTGRNSYQAPSYNSGSSGYVPSEQHIVIGRSSGRSDSYNRGPKVSGSQEYNTNPSLPRISAKPNSGLNQSGSGNGFEPSPRTSQVSSNSVNLSSPSSPRTQEPVSQNVGRSSYQSPSYSSGSSGYTPSESHITVGRAQSERERSGRGPRIFEQSQSIDQGNGISGKVRPSGVGSSFGTPNAGSENQGSGARLKSQPVPTPTSQSGISNSVKLNEDTVNKKWDMVNNGSGTNQGTRDKKRSGIDFWEVAKSLNREWSDLTGDTPSKMPINAFEQTAFKSNGRNTQYWSEAKSGTGLVMQIGGSVAGTLTMGADLRRMFGTSSTEETKIREESFGNLQSQLYKVGFGTRDGMNVRSTRDMKNLLVDTNRYSRKLIGKDITTMNADSFHSLVESKKFSKLNLSDQRLLVNAHRLLGAGEYKRDPETGKVLEDLKTKEKLIQKSELGEFMSPGSKRVWQRDNLLESAIRLGAGNAAPGSRQIKQSFNTMKAIGRAYKFEARIAYKGIRIVGSGVGTVAKTGFHVGSAAIKNSAAAGNAGSQYILAIAKKGNRVFLDIGQRIGKFLNATGAMANMLLNSKAGRVARIGVKAGKAVGKGTLGAMKGAINFSMDPIGTSAKIAGNTATGTVRVISKTAYKTKTVAIKGAKFVGKTRVGSAVTKSVKTAIRTTKTTITKIIPKPMKAVWSKLSMKLSILGQAKNAIVRGIQAFVNGINGIQDLISELVIGRLKKIGIRAGIYLFGAMLPVIVMAASLLVAMSVLTSVGDAVSDSLSEFKEQTTMGATYAKLLEKEQEFNEAVINIKDSIPVPTGAEYQAQRITQYTNQYVYYIGADGSQITWSGSVTWSGTTMSPDEVSDEVWEILKAKGWKEKSIAGLLGNFVQESSLNPAAKNENYHYTSSSTGITYSLSDVGLAQWTKQVVVSTGEVKVNRFDNYMSYAASKGSNYDDIETQLNFLISEDGYTSLVREYARTDFSSAAEAASWWMKKWEKPGGDGNESRRRAEAENMYAHYATGTDATDEEFIAANGEVDYVAASAVSGSSYSTSTIKGILSMAAVYIEQDFDTYGSFADGVFADSVYKDYCAKLYDSTHIIGYDTTPPTIYYCPAASANEAEPEYHVAEDGCNNYIEGGAKVTSVTDNSRSATISVKIDYDTVYYDEDDSPHKYNKATILASGPHGYTTFGKNGEHEHQKDAISEMKDRGCTNYGTLYGALGGIRAYESMDDDGSSSYEVCLCNLCLGHIDAEAYVFISNIYDPSSEVSDDQDSYDNVENKDEEPKYSMYVLDKYATAFDSGNKERYVYCTNPECSHYLDYSGDPYSYASVSPVPITPDDTKCPDCGTELEYPSSSYSHPGDEESIEAADATYNRQAEAVIMEDLTGKPIGIIDWWNNENWFTNFTTTKTYFRLSNLEESIDTLESPEKDENGDYNVINKTNSSPYWFNAFTSPSGRNIDFERHGWDNDSITQVRLLMAADWAELYGITDFGYISGAPLTNEQIAQLIGNTEEWQDLCDDRASIIATTILLQQKSVNYYLKYQLPPNHHYTIDTVVRGDTFDCSSYVYFIMYNAGLLNVKTGSTANIYGDGDFVQISASDLKPGDILLKYAAGGTGGNGNHVVIYMGGDNISEAKGSEYPLMKTWNHSGASEKLASGVYKAYRLKYIDEDTYDIGFSTLTEDVYDEDTGTVITNEGG